MVVEGWHLATVLYMYVLASSVHMHLFFSAYPVQCWCGAEILWPGSPQPWPDWWPGHHWLCLGNQEVQCCCQVRNHYSWWGQGWRYRDFASYFSFLAITLITMIDWLTNQTENYNILTQNSSWRKCGKVPMEPSETSWVAQFFVNQSFARTFPDLFLVGHSPSQLAGMPLVTRSCILRHVFLSSFIYLFI